jgi:DNA-binding IclR family transcriptional regulator
MTNDPAATVDDQDGSAGNHARPPGIVQSVDRAVALLEVLAAAGWASVTELARRMDVHKSTVSRLLSTLERRGMVERHERTQKYRLGFAVVRLASGVAAPADLPRIARSLSERLCDQTGETVNLAVLEGREVVNIDEVNRSDSVVVSSWLGRRTGLHMTSHGKVFLMHLPEAVRDEILNPPLQVCTPNTVTDPGELRAQLAEARTRGWAYTREELEIGLNAVAAPVFSADGTVVAALSTSGPAYRLTEARLSQVGTLTRRTAEEISRRLGWLGAAVI